MTDDEYDYLASFECELRAAIRRGAHLPREATSITLRGQGTASRVLADALRGRRRYSGFALAAAGILAAVLIVTVGLTKGTPRAFAGWTAAPSTPTKGQTIAAVSHCRSMIKRARSHGRPQRQLVKPPERYKTVAVDMRGPYTLSLLMDGNRQATCFSGPRASGHPVRSAGYDYIRAPAPAAGQISGFTGGITTVGGRGGQPSHMFAVGRVGTGVTGVTLLLAGGRRILTTTAKGWYLAWWPGHGHVLAAEVKTASGVLRHRMPGM